VPDSGEEFSHNMSSIDELTRGNVPEFRRRAADFPPERGKRLALAAVAVLAMALAIAGVILVIRRPSPRGPLATVSGPNGQGTCSAAFSPDGTTLAVADCGDNVFLWDISARRWAGTLTSPRCPRGGDVAFSPDGKTLALFSGDNLAACLWNLATRQETTLTDPGPRPYVAWTQGVFSPDGTTLAVADTTGNVYLWNLAAGRVTATVPAARDCGPVCPVAFSPDGTTLAVGESDGSGDHVYLWSLTARRWIATLTDPSGNAGTGGGGVVSLVFSRDGSLAVGDANGRAYVWDVAARRLVAAIAPPVNVAQGNASIAKDGAPYPVAGAFDHSVMVAFSPDGATLAASVSFGYGTYLYDVATRNRVATLTDPGGELSEAAPAVFSPDGTMLAVTDPNDRTYLWRTSG
jgi:WD40 repeat protein